MFIHEYGVNKIREMVRFELGKEIEKDAFFVLSRAWEREKLLSPHEESKLRLSVLY